MRGAVLAGGAARRYGGRPKGLFDVGGRRILDRVVEAVAAVTGAPPFLIANAPDAARPKEPLEAYPLESLKMVGTLSQKGVTYALVRADSSVYRVKIGNYLGQNFGVITGITDNLINLKELVQDASGDWTERKIALQIIEAEAAKGR